jgi:hypothetical protein
MKRMRILLGKRRFQVLVTMAGVLVALSVVVSSGASFTATAANAGNVFSAGTLTMSNTPTGMILTVENMVPGDSHSGTVVIKNTGSVSGNFQLEPVVVVENDGLGFADELTLDIKEGAVLIYHGPLADLGQHPLGTWASLESHTYDFKVTFPNGDPSVDNPFMGASTEATFNWSAVSLPGTVR